MIDRRKESRVETSLRIMIWGLDAQGSRFSQAATAGNISLSGALLSGIERELRCGDLIGVQYANRHARFRIVWTRETGNGERIQVAIHRLEAEGCPWVEELQQMSAH